MSTPAPQILHVTSEHAGETILAILRAWQPGQSWGAVRQLLSRRHVQINGNLCLDEGRRLKEGEVVRLLPYSAAPPPTEDDVKIRYLDQHLVVVEKPAGMTTLRHPEERNWPRSRKQLQPTLDEVLPRIIDRRERGGRRGPPGQPGKQPPPREKGPLRRLRAVHRLDRETSGLMVFARTIDAERELGLQFRAHSLARVYLAVVAGNLPHEETYESHLIEDRGDGRRGSTPNPKLGKVAITHVKPLERLGKYTVVECRLETGRTHQIRIHLSEAGHPLCGDKVYRGKFPGTPLPDESGAPRVALHAAELGFEHPITGEYLHHEMALPVDIVDLIDRLRGGRRGRIPRTVRTGPTSETRGPSQADSSQHGATQLGATESGATSSGTTPGGPNAVPSQRSGRQRGAVQGGRGNEGPEGQPPHPRRGKPGRDEGPSAAGRTGPRRPPRPAEVDEDFLQGGEETQPQRRPAAGRPRAGGGRARGGPRAVGGRSLAGGRTGADRPAGGRPSGGRPSGGRPSGERRSEEGGPVAGDSGTGDRRLGTGPARGPSSRPGSAPGGSARGGSSRPGNSRPGNSRGGKKPKRRRPGPPRG